MKRVLLKSSAFLRAAKKYSKTHPEAASEAIPLETAGTHDVVY